MTEQRKKEKARVLINEPLAEGIFRLRLQTEAAEKAVPGQFVNLYLSDGAHLLPRPISICEIDRQNGVLTLVYRVAGAGTSYFAGLKENDTVSLIAPVGNGFPLVRAAKKALFIGGGIGIPPMLAAAAEWKGEAGVVLGFREEAFLTKEFEALGYPVFISSDTGAVGRRGTVMDVIREEGLLADVVFACGPKPMLAAVKSWAAEENVDAYISMEERMACGVGACLGCVCGSTGTDDHSKVHNKRVCKDGPVFEAREVIL